MDEARLHDFMGKLVGDMGAAATLANVILGDELGLYRAMADSQPTTPEALAARTGCHPRLVREWLNAQAASGYMVHERGSFVLPEEQAMALALEDSPAYMAGGAAVVAALFHDKDKLVAAMRGDGALAWGDHHPCMFSGTERFFRPGYRTFLVADWLQRSMAWLASLRPAPRWRMSAAGMALRRWSWPRRIRHRRLSVTTTTRRPSPQRVSAPSRLGCRSG